MSFLPLTLLAYLLNSVAVLIDKVLLSKSIPNPLLYIFYISSFSLVALLGLPFTHVPELGVFALASFSTVLWTAGSFFMFKALKIGQATRVIPVIGTLIPVILAFMAYISHSISYNEIWAVIVLVVGLVFLVLPNFRGKLNKDELLFEVISALFFANSYVVLKMGYQMGDFTSVFVYSRFILIPFILAVLLFPPLKKLVLGNAAHHPKFNLWSKTGGLMLTGQAAGGISQLLLTFSISLASPAVVNALQGSQYVFLFLFSIFLAKRFPHIFAEDRSGMNTFFKIVGIIFIALGLYMLSQNSSKPIYKLGVTYSPRYAESLGLDAKKTFVQSLDELQIKNLRFPVYWDEVEKTQGKYDFSSADYYLKEAMDKNVDVVLVVGFKQPRWPECFAPEWFSKLSKEEQDQAILDLDKEEIAYFNKYPNIKYWQVENEPLLTFGDCPQIDYKRLKKEVELVKSLSPKPVLITDSGELTTWFRTMQLSDVFGFSLYRSVWNPLFGHVDYPLPPLFYTVKAKIIKVLSGARTQYSIVSELQGEPWATAKKNLVDMTLGEQTSLFPPQKLAGNVAYAKETGFKEIYLWGVEWWYYMKAKGAPEYIQTAAGLFDQANNSSKTSRVLENY